MTKLSSSPYPESVFLTPLSHLFSWRIYFFNSLSFFWRRSPPHFHFNGLQLSLLFLPHGMNDFAENGFGGVCVSASGFQTHPITNIKEASHSQVADVVFRDCNMKKPKNCNWTNPCAKEGNKINLIYGDPDASWKVRLRTASAWREDRQKEQRLTKEEGFLFFLTSYHSWDCSCWYFSFEGYWNLQK